MAPLVDRTELEALKRSDLQKLCKDHGLRANVKSEEMIDMLLEAQQNTDNSKKQPGRRSVSTRISSRPAGRTSSMIVHDIDEEEEVEAESEAGAAEQEAEEQPEPEPEPPQPRTRKAKETQFRLGVGRPLAAGGKGARAVTKSVSVSKSRKGKRTQSIKPTEATIEEELESEKAESEPKTIYEAPIQEASPPTPPGMPLSVSPSEIDARVKQALKPLHDQLKTLKDELGQMQSLKNELSQMRTKAGDIDVWKQKVETLTTEVKDLRERVALVDTLNTELQQLKESISTQRSSSTPTSEEAASGFRTPIMTRPGSSNLSVPRAPALVAEASTSGPSYLAHPGIAPVLLGKRHRDSTASNVSGVVEESEERGLSEADLVKTVIRPNKKRAKVSDGGDATKDEDAPRGASFTVFSGPEPEPEDSTPPNNPSNAGPSRPRATSSQDGTENDVPFSFSFLPVPPTPGPVNPYSMPSFPYPEPPQSPTPVRGEGNSSTFIGSRDRTDMFQAFGLPPPTRPRSRLEPTLRSQEAEMGAFINPAALDARGTLETADESSESSGIKRTMYGTELESDTRFGDFGLESVATDFNWTGAF
ncbi:hypothetical protein BDP27DRAFT_1327925 [Rhodocollybia butyracea]|uniref:SAP domain-containing protein n=1 Tax=Rhodocollybia butyracea TaxID=206335 RepID=A0A9P5PU16_9AGAR|nr:hypothetical protein BDP27DRAFT_1327925 [Rhodocollybia butyracea]